MSGVECEPCGRHFRLYQHYEDHLIHSPRHHYCEPCQRDFTSQNAKENHLRHSEQHMICKWCQTTVGKLRIHNQRYHEQCSECSQWCEDADEVHQHCRLAHSDVYCPPCRRIFSNPNNLDMHERSSIHQPKNVKCPHPACERGFISKAALVQHFEAGTCQSDLDLEDVDEIFSSRCDRDQQFVDRDRIFPAARADLSCDYDGRYQCSLCPKSFGTQGQLIAHFKSPKHKNHGWKAYECPSERCGRSEYYSLGNLMFHLETGDCEEHYRRDLSKRVDKLFNIFKRL
ncbi:hypothetical protein PGT21_035531 [Puccinia graminis f. sp. tritici]|uniref:C2H2-type domain-containing protein n=1 Tax=Puccinia graminis f. sp. tritici TaxID=56615 RepID=A0A5B0PZW2_PUCGR|nr:hypothetical protein PGT21_035531 [Puccinia graminis f. sp. tritici]KAA1126318.1 hypothetical protein PGTUg99_026364 [Puccinia graminis f. sp. tritici]